MRPTGEKDFLGEGQAHAVDKKKFAQVQGKIVWSHDQAWRRVIMELNQVIKRRLKNKPRTRKNVKAAGFYQEELSLPKRGHLIDGDAIDQIANVISVLGHDETAEQMFLRHFTFSLTKTEQESLEKFFDDGTLIPVDYKGFGIEDLRLEQKRSPYLAKSAKIKLTDWKI